MKTFAMISLGCKVNSYESNAIASMFEAADYFQVNFKELADVYIINTCTVTNMGDAKSRKLIRQAIKRNPDAIICVFGCYAQVSPEEIMEIEGVDIVLGTQYRYQLVDLVENHKKNKPVNLVEDILKVKEFEEFEATSFTSNQRAYLKIQEGCNKFCSYCIIPYARGLMRSRDKDSIINEARAFVAKGYHEIVLTGIHTGGYGIDLDNYDFDDLLEELLEKVPDLKRLRISSIEINQISQRTLNLFKNNSTLVAHLHVPIQAGSQKILELMKRDYSKEEYLNKINDIREVLPNIALTTDLIVGFPGESDDLFEESYQFIEKCNFSDIHVFPYSKRKGTPAASMKDQVKDEIKDQRVAKMIDLTKELRSKYYQTNLNKNLDIIIEGYDENRNLSYGLSGNYLKVYVDGYYEKGTYLEIDLVSVEDYPYGKVKNNEKS